MKRISRGDLTNMMGQLKAVGQDLDMNVRDWDLEYGNSTTGVHYRLISSLVYNSSDLGLTALEAYNRLLIITRTLQSVFVHNQGLLNDWSFGHSQGVSDPGFTLSEEQFSRD